MNLSDSKDGQIRNYMVVIIVLFTFGFLSILGMVIYLNMMTAWEDTGFYEGPVEENANKFLEGLKMFDKIITLIMVAMIIGVGVSSFKLRTSKVALVVSIILIPFMGFVSYFFNHLFREMVSDAAFETALVFFPITLLICTNLHWVALVAAIVGSITLYAKREPELETLG